MENKSKIKNWISVIAGIIVIFSPMLGAKWGMIVSVLALITYIAYLYKYDKACLKLNKKNMAASIIVGAIVALAVVVSIRIFTR